LSRKSSTACVELVFPTGKPMNTAALLPPQLATRELAFMNELIRGSDARHAKHLSKHESERLVMKLLTSLSQDQVEMLDSDKMRAASPPAACASVIAFLRALNEIPARDRARLLRAIYAPNQ